MGCGPVINGKQMPITPWKGSWAEQVNQPIPQHVKDHHADQFAATHTQRTILPGRYDAKGNSLQWPLGYSPKGIPK